MKNINILIVEDELIQAYALKRMIENLGHCVIGIASSKEEALKKAEAICPDLVIMDIALQGRTDGIDAAKEISARCHTPIIYSTAYSEEEIIKKAKETNPVGFLTKPFLEYDLKKIINDVLKKYKNN
jgi:CheY-like chemotaxis protein